MSAGLVGDVSSLRAFSQRLRSLPRVLAQRVAAKAAPELTRVARETFDAGEDAYGIPWVPLADGKRATLRKTGTLASKITYVAIGTLLRVVLGVPYARFQVGRRPIFPRQNEPLPASYVKVLGDVTQREGLAVMEGAST